MCRQMADANLKVQLLGMAKMVLDKVAANCVAYGLNRQLHVPMLEARGWLKRAAAPKNKRRQTGDDIQVTETADKGAPGRAPAETVDSHAPAGDTTEAVVDGVSNVESTNTLWPHAAENTHDWGGCTLRTYRRHSRSLL